MHIYLLVIKEFFTSYYSFMILLPYLLIFLIALEHDSIKGAFNDTLEFFIPTIIGQLAGFLVAEVFGIYSIFYGLIIYLFLFRYLMQFIISFFNRRKNKKLLHAMELALPGFTEGLEPDQLQQMTYAMGDLNEYSFRQYLDHLQFEKSHYSQLSFSYPTPMIANLDYRFVVEIASEVNLPEREAYITETKRIEVRNIMKCTLKSNFFKIDALNNDEQRHSAKEKTKWSWSIRPIKKGVLLLSLIVSTKNKIDGQDALKDLDPIERYVFVKANRRYAIKHFFIENWRFLIGLTATGLIWKLVEIFVFKQK